MNCRSVRAALVAALILSAAELFAQTSSTLPPPIPTPFNAADPQPAPPPPVPPADDHTSILRFDPFQNKLLAVAPAEVKPGLLYNHFHDGLDRRVWGIAQPGGGFAYAMGEGSVQPAALLGLQATEAQRRATIERYAPSLAATLHERGGTVFVRLNPAQGWELVPYRTIASIWDLETFRRWEWHGERRVPVIHTFGDTWTRIDGKYEPATSSLRQLPLRTVVVVR